MYRIWIGLDPRMILGALGSGLMIMALVIHLFAFKVVNYPSGGARYATYHAVTK